MSIPENIAWFPVDDVGGYVSAVERMETPSVLALDNLGTFSRMRGMVSQRDRGTQHRTRSIPIRPNTFTDITNVTDNAGTIRITSTGHGYNSDDVVYIGEVGGTVEANGRWVITWVDANTYDLNDSVYTNAYTSGGIATKTPITVIDDFTFYDKDADQEHEIIAGLDSSDKLHFYVDTSSTAGVEVWKDLTHRVTAQVSGTPGVGSTVNIASISETLTTNQLAYFLVRNTTQSPEEMCVVVSNTASQLTIDNANAGAGGLAWQDTDTLEIYATTFAYLEYKEQGASAFDVGTAPWIQYNAIEAQRRVSVYWGTSANPSVMRKPFAIYKANLRQKFWDDATDYLLSLPAGFYADRGGADIMPSFQELGSKTAYRGSGGAATQLNFYDENSSEIWMTVYVDQDAITDTNDYQKMVMVMCVEYDGYQITNPIFRGFFEAPPSNDMKLWFHPRINAARMNKRITALHLFAREFNSTEISAGLDALDVPDDELSHIRRIPLDDEKVTDNDVAYTWLNSADATYKDAIYYAHDTVDGAGWIQSGVVDADGGDSLTEYLGHQAVYEARTLPTPRYSTRVTRSQGALVATEKDDSTLNLSVVSLRGIHMEDHIAHVSTDARTPANNLIISLLGRGTLLQLAIKDDTLYAFRESEFETYDLHSQIQSIQPCDFYAQRSLVVNEYGMFWTGKYGVYWMPAGREDIVKLDGDWGTEFSGEQLIDDNSAPYINDSARKAVISGHSPNTDEYLMQVQRNRDIADGGGSEYIVMAFSSIAERWRRRRFSIGTSSNALIGFSKRNDGSSTLIHSEGLLKYPILTGTTRYEDDVSFDGISSSNGVSVRLEVNIPDLASHKMFGELVAVKIIHRGFSKDSDGFYQLDLIPNREEEPYDTQYFYIGKEPEIRMVELQGLLQGLRLVLSIPSSQLPNMQDMDISRILLGFSTQPLTATI